MKWWKRYSFLIMILISGIGYKAGTFIKDADFFSTSKSASGVQLIAEQKNTGEFIGRTVADNEKTTEILAQFSKDVQGDNQNPGDRKFQRVEMDYLSDALFIGDSRTSILYDYAGWNETDFFVKNGLGIWDVWEEDMDGKMLADMLDEKQYGKIYIMLGLNELEMGTHETFRLRFEKVLNELRRKQPQAVIFLESIIHVTADKDAEGTYINNDTINIRNQELMKLADGEHIIWLDTNEAMDEPGTGKLNPALTGDGVHIQAKNIPLWREFILDHGILK